MLRPPFDPHSPSALPVHIGTAGWSIASRYDDAIPRGGTHLERYARHLDAAEINSSFYRPHQAKTYARWAASTPAHFRFSVKLPKIITHEKRLVACEADLDRFAGEVAGLGGKLGVLLIQLPPSGRYEARTFDAFIAALQSRCAGVAFAIEPRHASWFTPSVEAHLAALGVARVAADPAPVPGAGEAGGDRRLVYLRWHGAPRIYYSDYDAAALGALRRRIAAHLAAGAQVWCIFDNTALGAALGNALALAAALQADGISCSFATATPAASARG